VLVKLGLAVTTGHRWHGKPACRQTQSFCPPELPRPPKRWSSASKPREPYRTGRPADERVDRGVGCAREFNSNGTRATYSDRVYVCLTGDRDERPNAGEERSLLRATAGPMPATRDQRALALNLGTERSGGTARPRRYGIELALPARWNGQSRDSFHQNRR